MADNFNISDTPATASAGPASVEFNYDFDTDTTIADPGSKRFRYDNATPASVTKIAISEIANSGVNTSTLLNAFILGDHIYIEQTDQAGNNQLYRVTSIIDNGSWHQLNVSEPLMGGDRPNEPRAKPAQLNSVARWTGPRDRRDNRRQCKFYCPRGYGGGAV